MLKMEKDQMRDIQNGADDRGIPIDQVGVSGIIYPITVWDRDNERQRTTATISMSVGLPHDLKGAHLSRFLEVLNDHRGEVTMSTMPVILRDLKDRLNADSARMEVSFPYFMEKAAPASGASGLMGYNCKFIGETNGPENDFILVVEAPITTLCPCSKAISDYGAHNQRGVLSISVRTKAAQDGTEQFIWIEELVEWGEACASAPIYPILKRVDERHVTMQAYDNPLFVEDVVRNMAVKLKAEPRVAWFYLRAETLESIHNHNAFAELTVEMKEHD
jgi:GTP cyclohydrolase I